LPERTTNSALASVELGAEWFDPLEEAVRGQVPAFIERLLEEELDAALGRGRYARDRAAKGHRNVTANVAWTRPSLTIVRAPAGTGGRTRRRSPAPQRPGFLRFLGT
jgi:hypothetical protein